MKNKLGTEDAIKRWDQNAEIITENYNEHGDLHREVLLNPALFRLVGEETFLVFHCFCQMDSIPNSNGIDNY